MDDFTPNEWEMLKHLHYQVFSLVAGSDGHVDRKEWAALERQLQQGPMVENPLHRRLLVDILKDGADRITDTGLNRMPPMPQTVKAVLRRRLSNEEYHDFIDSLFAAGLDVARASGAGLFGLGNPVSAAEKAALNAFAVQFDLDSKALRGRLGID